MFRIIMKFAATSRDIITGFMFLVPLLLDIGSHGILYLKATSVLRCFGDPVFNKVRWVREVKGMVQPSQNSEFWRFVFVLFEIYD